MPSFGMPYQSTTATSVSPSRSRSAARAAHGQSALEWVPVSKPRQLVRKTNAAGAEGGGSERALRPCARCAPGRAARTSSAVVKACGLMALFLSMSDAFLRSEAPHAGPLRLRMRSPRATRVRFRPTTHEFPCRLRTVERARDPGRSRIEAMTRIPLDGRVQLAEEAVSARAVPALSRAHRGDRAANDELMTLVYEDLRRLADRYLSAERSAQTLQPTALVHEAYLRLAASEEVWQSRAHFFGAAARAIRRILLDRARARNADRRGGGRGRLSLEVAAELAIDGPRL